MKLHYQDDYIIYGIDESVPCLFVKFVGLPESNEHHRRVTLQLIDYLHQQMHVYPGLPLLTDGALSNPASPEDIEWMYAEIYPRFFKAGVQFNAIIVPYGLFGSLSLDEFNDHLKTDMAVKVFYDVEKAKQWLKNAYLTHTHKQADYVRTAL